MEARVHHAPGEFWSIAGPLYSADPIRHTLALTVCRRMLHAPDPDEPPPTLVTLWTGDRLAGATFLTPPFLLVGSALPAKNLDEAAAALLDVDPELPGVSGPRDTGEPFAQAWSTLTGAAVKEVMAQRLYRLARLEPPVIPGRARVATDDDADLIVGWRRNFEIEAVGHQRLTDAQVESMVRRSLALGNGLLLWEVGGRAVAHAAVGRPIGGMSRVGPVYTPPELRGRGYGTAVTAAATQWALDAGAENVLLFTDLANPTSNSIYRRIGYRPVLDCAELEFHK
jgi:GNAT superfamily N-acetyltransferase